MIFSWSPATGEKEKKKKPGVSKNVCFKSLTEEGNNEGKRKLTEENILFSGT